MKKIMITTLAVLVSAIMYAQQNPQYSQYIFNMMVINPAYAGSKDVLNLNGLHRSQWTGLEGSPSTQTVSVDASAGKAVGLGLYVINDNLGAQRQTAFFGSFAYRFQISEDARLSFGLAGGASQFSIDGSKLTSDNPDPSVPLSLDSRIIPDAKGGVFFNTKRFYAGLSVSDLLSHVHFEKEIGIIQGRHYFFTTGYVFDIGKNFKFKPSILLKEDFKGPANIDLNAFVLFYEKVWLGASYRTGTKIPGGGSGNSLSLENAVALITELYATDKLRIGYSYDITGSTLKNYSSHEISLGYFFYKKQDTKMVSPRYF